MTDPKTLARTENPQTSKDAAKRMVESGELSRQEKMVCGEIIRYHYMLGEDFTTKDIALQLTNKTMPYDKAYDICRKRFSGLFNKMKIVLTGERRDGCRCWRLL